MLVRKAEGKLTLLRKDAGELKVTALDLNGYPLQSMTGAAPITLAAGVLYYIIEE